ncbi:glycerophosphodiester phosphodiesterase family protein [Marinobacterium rhizophilum]|uniref:glycerophosphodiester phosphodiesterase family protein n=1 Tax=Marinobacterium rhizophilum TaxID=420402 RepID=UPI0003743EA5|nr:glycerophosphodiester phosphodiesterase family protein [Marinobacterium rhizophilum]
MMDIPWSDRLVAHRGYAARYPENTLLAVREALNAGAQFVEVDIQLSADRVVVVFHDDDTQRLCGRGGTVQALHRAELSALSCHYPSRFGEAFEGESLATLSGLRLLMQQFPDVVFFIELKRGSIEHFGRREFLQAAASGLAAVMDQVVLISYDREILQQAAALGWRIGVVQDQWPEADDQQLQQLMPEFLFLEVSALPEGPLAWQQARLAVFEVAQAGMAQALMQRGIELVETFDIGEMRYALNCEQEARDAH